MNRYMREVREALNRAARADSALVVPRARAEVINGEVVLRVLYVIESSDVGVCIRFGKSKG